MAWEVEGTDEFAQWYRNLDEADMAAVAAAVDRLEQHGPNLKRPTVGAIKGSKHDPRMKELRTRRGFRVLFTFDPRRTAILLVGGNKTGQWSAWYREAIPEADRLYDEYLDELREEGVLKDG